MTYLICCQAVWLLTGCSTEDLPQGPVAADFVMSATKSTSPGATRMSADKIVGSAHDIAVLCAIPFATDGKIGLNDVHKPTPLPSTHFEQAQHRAIFHNAYCSFDPGVNSVLAYARKKTRTSPNATTGWLDATFPANYDQREIRFDLRPIITVEQLKNNQTAQSIAQLMTDIATAWQGSTDTRLRDQYDVFRNYVNAVFNVLPGSSANIIKWVEERKVALLSVNGLSDTDKPIRTNVINAMENLISQIPTDFPHSIGLPDGAAVIRWNGEAFAYETETTTMGNINGVDRFAYPAELYYYGNSTIKVSDNDAQSVLENDNNSEWSTILSSSFTNGNVVTSSTKAIAMEDPLQYGVARLQVKLKAVAGSLNDKNSTPVSIGTSSNPSFPLTGIIIGGQLPVGFDFTPASLMPVYSETDMKFIYDSEVTSSDNYIRNEEFGSTNTSNSNSFITNTLVLQTYDNKKLQIALEFENNSSTDFVGSTGIVYKDTKFYLVGEIEPNSVTESPSAYDNRVFTQDYTTTVQFTVKSLEKAYNVLPDLMSPRLELGLELTPQWVQTTPTDVELNPFEKTTN